MSYKWLLKDMYDLKNMKINVRYEKPKYSVFPFKWCFVGQNEAIETILREDLTIFTSPTGSGKTAVFMTALALLGGGIVIEPRVALQKQVASYDVGVPVVYWMSREKYDCPFNHACKRRFSRKGCEYFYYNGNIYPFPCEDCPYERDKERVIEVLEEGGIAVLNHGNFWYPYFQNLRRDFPLIRNVVIDEVDEFCRLLTSPVTLPAKYFDDIDDPLEVIDIAKKVVNDALTTAYEEREVYGELVQRGGEKYLDKIYKLNSLIESLLRLKFKLNFIEKVGDIVIYRENDTICIEPFVDTTRVVKLLRFLFPAEKLVLVSATMLIPKGVATVQYEVPQRARIYVTPVADLCRSRLREGALERVGRIIEELINLMPKIGEPRKAVVHCGNLDYANVLNEVIKLPTILHERGKLEVAIEKFKDIKEGVLLATAMEYGVDFPEIPIQFILKMPFPNVDEKVKAIREKLGEQAFWRWYAYNTISKLVQACGRNARGVEGFSATFILDYAFVRWFKRYKSMFPSWFVNRLNFRFFKIFNSY